MYSIEFCDEESEVKKYLEKLQKSKKKVDRIEANKVRLYINLLKEYGLALGEPYIKHIDGKIWELRPIRKRIFFASIRDNKFILLSIFTKKTKKTPKREIEKANRILKKYHKGGK